jgi:hypothetical protein
MEPEPKPDLGFATISVKKGTKGQVLVDKLETQKRIGREMDYDELIAFMSEVFREMSWLNKREIFGRMARREDI